MQRGLTIAAGALAILLLIAAYVWRADIHEAFLDPGVPFQIYKPPLAPDYAKTSSWAVIPAQPTTWTINDPAADIFFVHPTTYDGGRDWNAPIGELKADRFLTRTVLPNYAGPFRRVGRVFAPRYRQASLYTLLTSREDAREARVFAYGDIAAAFRLYLQQYNRGRPIIIVGVEQGGFLAERLAREAAADPAVAPRLAVVYLIETAVPDQAPPLTPCVIKTQPRCVVAWMSKADGEPDTLTERLRHSLVWRGQRADGFGDQPLLCVNPVTGTRNGEASPKAHLGGVNASKLEWDARPGILAHQVGAKCETGFLHLTRARSATLRASGSWIEMAKVNPFSIFYADLEVDAQGRVDALLTLPGFGKLAPPIDKVIEIGPRRP